MGTNRKKMIVSLVMGVWVTLFVAPLSAEDSKEAMQRALYHAKELQTELENLDIEDREVVLRKAEFIKERLQEKLAGNPSGVENYKPVMNERSKQQ